MMKTIILVCILLGNLSAVGEAGAIFLLIAPGAGPQGTGEAQVAKADDAYASFYNPAGLGFLKGKEAAGMHVQWLPNLADDLFYEFIAYRHELPGVGVFGSHLIYLNLGKQINTDDRGNNLGEFPSWMGAIAFSFGTKLTTSTSMGLSYKIFHQALAPFGAGAEDKEGASTDFAFDIGYLKKFKQSEHTFRRKKKKNINRIFKKYKEYYDQQVSINDKIYDLREKEKNIYDIIEDQEVLIDEIQGQKETSTHYNLPSSAELGEKMVNITNKMEGIIDSLKNLSIRESNTNAVENIITGSEDILFTLMDIESLQENMLRDVEEMEIAESDDKFNFGLAITNIGPPIDFINKDQADPSPTNMRIGIFANLYNDGFNKVNLLFDANKILVARYPAMDWNGDGLISGNDEVAHHDPWYTAIFTAWLDDWYLGGDTDYNEDRMIGGYICPNGQITQSLEQYNCDAEWSYEDSEGNNVNTTGWQDNSGEYAFAAENYGLYGIITTDSTKAYLEKGSGDNRSFKTELEEMIYNIGLEYWYSDNFVLRTGYIYDIEGDVLNPTFGAGIRLLEYGFDFGYTAGKQGHPRANTMFFSINMKL